MARRALVFFPCNVHLARMLLDYAGSELAAYEIDSLLLETQTDVDALLDDAPVARRFRLAEPFYGLVSAEATTAALEEAAARGYDLAVFPASAFRGNAYLLGACLAQTVRCVNVAHHGPERTVVDVPGRGAPLAPTAASYAAARWDPVTLENARARLAELAAPLQELAGASGDERPTSGLVQGFPHDLAVFVRYLWAARASRGLRVLEVGSGIGYGASVIAGAAAEVAAVEPDPGSVAFSRRAWEPFADGRLHFVEGTAGTLAGLGTFDRVVCFEVLEHLDDAGPAMRAFAAALDPGGLLIASTPDPLRFPFRVNRDRELEASAEELQARGIWKWHLAGIPPAEVVQLALASGFEAARVLFPTYVAGPGWLAAVRTAGDVREAVRRLDASANWRLDDFDVTAEFSPTFSGFSYVLVARRGRTSTDAVSPRRA